MGLPLALHGWWSLMPTGRRGSRALRWVQAVSSPTSHGSVADAPWW